MGRIYFLVDQKTVYKCWQFLEWKLQVEFNSETSSFRVNLFQLLYSTVGRLEELIVETLRVKPSESDFCLS